MWRVGNAPFLIRNYQILEETNPSEAIITCWVALASTSPRSLMEHRRANQPKPTYMHQSIKQNPNQGTKKAKIIPKPSKIVPPI